MPRLLLLLAIMATWFVDGVNGSDAHAGTSFAQAFKTIAHAESVAAAGDTVTICATGAYTTTASLALSVSGDFTSGPVTWIGANASGVVDGTHAAITTATNGVNLIALNAKNNRVFRYLDLSSTADTPAAGIATSSNISSYVAVKDCSITGCKDGIYAGYLEGPEYLIYSLDVTDTYIANCTRDAVRVAGDALLDAVGLYGNGGKGVNVPGAIGSSTSPRITVERSILAANAIGASVANVANNSEPVLVLQGCTIAGQTGDGVDWLAASGNPAVVAVENTIFYGNGGYAAFITNPAGVLLSINRYNATGSNTSGSSLPPGTGNVSLTASPFAGGSSPNSLATLRAYYALNTTAGGGASCRAAGYPAYLDIGALQHQDAGGGGSAPNTPSIGVADNGNGTGGVATISGSTAGCTNTVDVVGVSSSGALTWSQFTRTGDGTVSLSLSDGRYLATVSSALGGQTAAPSEPYDFVTTGGGSASDIRSALYAWLTSQSAITTLVADNVFPLKAPQGVARPYVLYRRSTAGEGYLLKGSAQRALAKFELDACGDSYASATAVRNALAAAIDTIQSTQVGNVLLYAAIVADEQDDFDEPIDGGDTGVVVIRLVVELLFTLSSTNP